MALRLLPIDLEAHDAASLLPFMTAARALVEDFEASFEPGVIQDDEDAENEQGEGSSRTGWRLNRSSTGHGTSAAIQVKTARGRALGTDVRDRVGADETWIGRLSTHGKEEADWDEWQNLLKDKEGADAEWIPELKGLEVIQAVDIPPSLEAELGSAAAVWISRLALPMPLQDRAFLCLVMTTSTADEFWNVSVPFAHDDYPPGKKGEAGRTRGTYVSVERVRKLPTGKVEWIVLTSFSLGGNVIPQPIVNLKMAYKLVDDVGHFLDWVRDSRRRRQQHSICDAT